MNWKKGFFILVGLVGSALIIKNNHSLDKKDCEFDRYSLFSNYHHVK